MQHEHDYATSYGELVGTHTADGTIKNYYAYYCECGERKFLENQPETIVEAPTIEIDIPDEDEMEIHDPEGA